MITEENKKLYLKKQSSKTKDFLHFFGEKQRNSEV